MCACCQNYKNVYFRFLTNNLIDNIILNTFFRSNNDVIKKKNSPLRENKRQNSDDFIPLNVNNDESNSKKSKYTNKNKK